MGHYLAFGRNFSFTVEPNKSNNGTPLQDNTRMHGCSAMDNLLQKMGFAYPDVAFIYFAYITTWSKSALGHM